MYQRMRLGFSCPLDAATPRVYVNDVHAIGEGVGGEDGSDQEGEEPVANAAAGTCRSENDMGIAFCVG
jgi:hypothetical protein